MENKISTTKNILFVLPPTQENLSADFEYLIENFCGKVEQSIFTISRDLAFSNIYVCGDISQFQNEGKQILIIKELSSNYEDLNSENIQLISLGEVPIIIHKAGVYFRNLFGKDDFFGKIKVEHEFQQLTESNKPGVALRRGIYLTEVTKDKGQREALHYRLLRCSSNLTGPTDNFRKTDHFIINKLNEVAEQVFEDKSSLNHVLAQIYENKKVEGPKNKEIKAKIKAHSDKTKDMSKNGLIAFCTFYDESGFQALQPSQSDRFDWCYKQTSGLTRLYFKLKDSVTDESLKKEFSLTLYPNSAFIIPLSTNRLYTHEIRPSMLNIDRIPTRMGYVVRCSKTEAIHIDNQTYIKENGELIKLEKMTSESMKSLRDTYYEENKTKNKVQYGKVHFSMNLGDYQKPII
jgi:hypothetical protein